MLHHPITPAPPKRSDPTLAEALLIGQADAELRFPGDSDWHRERRADHARYFAQIASAFAQLLNASGERILIDGGL